MLVSFEKNPASPTPYSFIVAIEKHSAVLTLYRQVNPGEEGVRGETVHRELRSLMVRASKPLRIDLKELAKRPDYQDQSLWTSPADLAGPALGNLFNTRADTVDSKLGPTALAQRNQENYLFLLSVPSRQTTSMEDCALALAVSGALPLVCNKPVREQPGKTTVNQMKPVVRLTGPDTVPANGYSLLSVSVRKADNGAYPHEFEVYLEHTGGYLPKQRVTTVNGQATFKVGALGLDAGDSFKVKAGTRLISGMSEKVLKVV